MPKYYDAALGLGSIGDFVQGAGSFLKDRVVEPFQNLQGLPSDVRQLGDAFTTYPTEGFQRPNSFHNVITDILEAIRTGTEKGAEITGGAGAIAGKYGLPLVAGVTPGANLIPTKYTSKIGEVAGQFVGAAAPYVAATAAAPEAVAPALGVALSGQALALAGSAADRYERGEISGPQALFEIGMNVGPIALGPVAKALGKGTSALGRFVKTSEGQAAITDVANNVENARKIPSRVSRMTPEERMATAQPRSMDAYKAALQKDVARQDINIQRLEQRVNEPLTDRPAGRKGGVYLNDLLTDTQGNRYTEDILKADAGEMTTRPVIDYGKFKYRSKSGADQSVGISVQEAQALRDLYDQVPSPTEDQVYKALQDVEGRAPKLPRKKDAAGNFEDQAQGIEPQTGTTRSSNVTRARAKQVKEYIETKARQVPTLMKRPLPDSPELRQANIILRNLNSGITSAGVRISELDTAISADRQRLGVATNRQAAEKIARDQVRKEMDRLNKSISGLGMKSPKRQQMVDEAAHLADVLDGKEPLPDALMNAVAEKLKAPEHPVIRSRLSQNEEEWRLQNRTQQELMQKRGDHLELAVEEVPHDPHEQLNLLIQKYAKDNNLPPVLPPSKAAEMLKTLRETRDSMRGSFADQLEKEKLGRQARLDLIDAMDRGDTGGRVPYDIAGAAHDYRAYTNALETRNANPAGIDIPAAGTESLANYAKLAIADAFHEHLGVKNVGNLGVSTLRSLAARLLGAAGTDGPASGAFVMVDGVKTPGTLKLVQPNAQIPVEDWHVEFTPSFSKSRETIKDLTVKDVQLEYKQSPGNDAIAGRYSHEREIINNLRSEEQARVLGSQPGEAGSDVALRQELASKMQASLASIDPMTITDRDFRPADYLQGQVDAAWSKFEKHLTPLAPELGDTPTTQAKFIHDGFMDMINSPLPKNKVRAAQTIEARANAAKEFRRYMDETSGVAFDDPDLKDIVDANGDPVIFGMYLRGRSLNPEDIVKEPSLLNVLPRKVRNAMDFIQGRGYADMRVRGINAGHRYAEKGIAANIWRNFNGITMAWRKAAVDAMEEGTKVGLRPKQFRMAYGDTELANLLSKAFDSNAKIVDPALAKGMADIQALPDSIKAELLDRISREHRWAMDYPTLFPGLPDSFTKIGEYGRAMVNRTAELAAVDTGKTVSNGYLNRLMLATDMRDRVNQNTLTEGHPFSVLADAAQVAHNIGKPLSEVLTTGDDLLRAEPLAHWQASLNEQTMKSIIKLAPEGEKITTGLNGDIHHTAGRWSIKSLDKWKVLAEDGGVDWQATKDLQTSIKQLEQGLNRMPDWKGLLKASQAVASVALSADANIVSVQGYSAISSKILWELGSLASGRKIKTGDAMGKYVSNLWDTISDEGYHAWYRTRADDIQYYSSLGLSVGQEGFIAGPKLNSLPLENMPFIGKGVHAISGFNDLQFNRLLMYMKVQAVDQMLGKAQIFRRAPDQLRQWSHLPGLKSVVEEAAGESPYLHAQPEHVVKAAIRTVNNKLGGIDLNAQGIVQWRQTAEQLMSITPGFFRAQAGMFTTALTRPHSVEGWLAMTGAAEEVAFAAGVATLIAAATGNTDKLNLTDMRRPDWMAVPFGDSYIPIIPRVSIPRLAARTLSATIQAAEGNGFDVGPSLQSFAQGRLSPIVNATLAPAFFDADFLGRRYRDKKDRAIASLTSFLPIFAENVITDAREGVSQNGWGAVGPAAAQTPLQWLGKNVVPRPPIEKLDDISKNWTSQQTPNAVRGWFDLTQQEQQTILTDPKSKAAYDDYKYYTDRRADPKETQIEAQFTAADEQTNALRTQPIRWQDGTVASMADLYTQLQSGIIDGDHYRQKYQFVSGKINQIMEDQTNNLARLGFDMSGKHADRVARLKKLFGNSGNTALMTQVAVWDSEQIQPENYTVTKQVQTDNGPINVTETDWNKYQADKDAILATYPDNIRLNVAAYTDKWHDQGVDAYRQSSQLRSKIEELPRYEGLNNDQADKLDAMTKSFRDLNDVVRAKIGLPGSIAPLPQGMSQALRAVAVKQFVQQGFIKTPDDAKLAMLSILMQEKPILKDALRGRAQLSALISNPNVLMFYPYLMGRVPVWMRGRLPQNLQPQFDVQQRYQALAG